MTEVAIVRAIGDGGYQEPRAGTYISSQRDTIVGYSDWVENLVNHDKVKLVEGPFEGSNYGEYVNYVAQADGDMEKGLEAYRKVLPAGNKNHEKVKVVESPADADRQEKEEKTAAKPSAPAAAPKTKD